jgi:hypothetical protein
MKNLKEQSLVTFDKILVPSLLTFISWASWIQMWLILAYGFFWVVMQYKQDDVNNFVQILKDNPWIFTKEILETKEFQDGFVLILEKYIRERGSTKKEIIKNILLWFTQISQEKKEKFKLEKILDILNRITETEISILNEIDKWEIDEVIKKKTSSIHCWDEFIAKEYHDLKYFESLGLIYIHLDTEVSEIEEQEWDEEDWYFNTGKFYTKINNFEFFELSEFWDEFIKYIKK